VIRTPLCRPTRKPLESSALKLELPREDGRDLCPQNSRQRKSSEIQSFHIASSIFVCILLISLSRNQVQLVACKALLFQHAKDLSLLTLIFNLCSIFCSFTSKCMSNPNYNLFTTKTLQSHHGTHKSNSNSNSTSVLQPTSPPRCSIMSGTGGSSRYLVRKTRGPITNQDRVLLTDNTNKERPNSTRQPVEAVGTNGLACSQLPGNRCLESCNTGESSGVGGDGGEDGQEICLSCHHFDVGFQGLDGGCGLPVGC
jgi:hypothetical protein